MVKIPETSNRPIEPQPWHSNPKKGVKVAEIDILVNKYAEKLKNAPHATHGTIIRALVVDIYRVHGYNLWPGNRGGHMMDVIAENKADLLLNDSVVEVLKKLSLISSTAQKLLLKAENDKSPVADIV